MNTRGTSIRKVRTYDADKGNWGAWEDVLFRSSHPAQSSTAPGPRTHLHNQLHRTRANHHQNFSTTPNLLVRTRYKKPIPSPAFTLGTPQRLLIGTNRDTEHESLIVVHSRACRHGRLPTKTLYRQSCVHTHPGWPRPNGSPLC